MGFQRARKKNQQQKGHNKCKANANRLPRKNRKMDARKGGRFFHKNLRHPSFDLSKTKRTKTFEDNSVKERGRRFFHKKQSFRALPRRQTNLISKQQTLQQKIPPGNDSLGRGGDVFSRTTLTSVAPDKNKLHPKRSFGKKKRRRGGRHFSPRAPQQYNSANFGCKYA